jgi:nucleotide-binding universal stress UspA family protein
MKLKPSKKVPLEDEKKRAYTPLPVSLKRILVPIDFSEHSKDALTYANTLAEQFRSELILVYVVEPIVYPSDLGFGQVAMPNLEPEFTARGKAGLAQLIKEHVMAGLTARAIVQTGRAFLEILNTAKEEHVDLIVIATHGHAGVEHLIFGSTAEKVVKRARCPVLMVRPGGYFSPE